MTPASHVRFSVRNFLRNNTVSIGIAADSLHVAVYQLFDKFGVPTWIVLIASEIAWLGTDG